jgi:hypothetical protein
MKLKVIWDICSLNFLEILEKDCVISEERSALFRNVKVVLLRMTQKWQYTMEKFERICPKRGCMHQITHSSTWVSK